MLRQLWERLPCHWMHFTSRRAYLLFLMVCLAGMALGALIAGALGQLIWWVAFAAIISPGAVSSKPRGDGRASQPEADKY